MPDDTPTDDGSTDDGSTDDTARLRTLVRDVTVRRTEGVDLVFEDDHEVSFTLEQLRLACPCAHCRGRRDAGQAAWTGNPATLEVRDAELVGAWGLRLVWQDGHGTGIYPWQNLRRWADAGAPQWGRDSGLGG